MIISAIEMIALIVVALIAAYAIGKWEETEDKLAAANKESKAKESKYSENMAIEADKLSTLRTKYKEVSAGYSNCQIEKEALQNMYDDIVADYAMDVVGLNKAMATNISRMQKEYDRLFKSYEVLLCERGDV